ncbi:lipopolysaccharide biosynthesis protein [Ningiella sp. W23]|uniref:lipopolysaccharide biosynthesis protein n=1 Tax=Ningiella sp. W23 TaxID=3023715 RepID=UPI0037573FD4
MSISDKAQKEKEKKDIQQAYIRSLEPGQFDDTAFLKSEVERLLKTDPVIVERLFVRLGALNRDNQQELNSIRGLRLKWELENTAPTNLIQKSKKEHDQTTDSNPAMEGNDQPRKLHLTAQQKRWLESVKRNAFVSFVIAPVVLFAIYLIVLASPRYESQAQLLVQQSKQAPSFEPSLALLSGIAGGAERNDVELVKAYINSSDMLIYLEQSLEFTEHYMNDEYDYFSRLESDATLDDRVSYFQDHVEVSIDPTSTILTINVQAFTPDFAQQLNMAITNRAEWFINEIGQNLAKAQVAFMESEHARVEQRFQDAQTRLLSFQREYNLLDPEAEGMALQQITFALESEIASKSAQLNALKSSMSEQAPLVVKVQEELTSLRRQLISERDRLTNAGNGSPDSAHNNADLGVNDIVAKFSDYKIDLEFALQAYTASKVILETTRVEAYQQLKYLVMVETPTLPEDSKYPRVLYNLALLFVCLVIVFGIAKLIIATADELK